MRKNLSLILALTLLCALVLGLNIYATNNMNEQENATEEVTVNQEDASENKEKTKLEEIREMFDLKKVFNLYGKSFLSGLKITILSTVVSLVFAMILGLISCFMSLSKIKLLNWISKFYIWIIRGTPLIVLGLMFYFALPQVFGLFGISLMWAKIGGVFTVSVIVLALNAGAYISEIFRAGMLAVPKGQEEAARSLGLSKVKALRRVILPQAIKVAVPSLVNQCIITLKDTSILMALGLRDLVYHAKNAATQGGALATYTVLAAFYLIVVTALTVLSHYVERKTDYAKKNSNK